MTGASGKSANPWWRRLQLAWQALLGRQRHKSNETRFRDFGELRSKQVAFPDSAEARRVETLLRESAALELFPPFMFRLESTVWVRFVPGHRPNPRDPGDLEAMCRFFTALYRFRPVECRLDQTDLQPRLIARLRILCKAGRLDQVRLIELEQLAERLRPPMVWTGLDYIDALAKNFIIGRRGAVGVDIEAIGDGELLGTGLAKARHRWLGEAADPFLDALVAGGGPDLRPQYAYTQLQFLAHYGVQNLVRGKQGRIRADDFDALLSAASNADGSRQP
ncbi:MAG: hypothetical protein RQ741_10185 [Wenzhouxiangellaceae bacterium]|nr:hypothetical protein [Wenzhouxiangellaceae bacterium]